MNNMIVTEFTRISCVTRVCVCVCVCAQEQITCTTFGEIIPQKTKNLTVKSFHLQL